MSSADNERHWHGRLEKQKMRRARRHWDFLTLLGAGNGLGIVLMWILPEPTTTTMLLVVGGMMLFTLTLSWRLFVARDDE